MGTQQEIKVKYSIINSEFNSKIKEINSQMRALDKEFKLQKETMKNSASASQKLEASLENLKSKYDLAKQKTEETRQALENAKNVFGENSKEAQQWSMKLTDCQTAEARLSNAIGETNSRLEEARRLESESARASEQRKQALSSLSAEQEKLQATSEKLTKEYELEKMKMGENASYSERLKAKQEYLAKAYENSRQQVENLDKQLEISKQEFGENSVEVNKLEKELTEAKIAMLEFEKANKDANDKIKIISERSAEIGGKLQTVGDSLTKKVTVPLLGIATGAVKVASDFEAGMSEVKAISGATGDDFTKLRDKAMEMGAKTKYSATESAEAMKYMALAGWKTQDMVNGISGIMNLAAASGENLASVSDIVTDGLTAFGLSAKDSGMFADVLASSTSNANVTVATLGETFKYAGPVAGALGYSIQDVALAAGLMGNAGIKASQAGTSLRTAMTSLANPTGKAAEIMEQLGIKTQDSEGNMLPLRDVLGQLRTELDGTSESAKAYIIQTIFGKEAMAGMLAIVNANERDFQKLSKSIDNSQGSAKKMADIMNDNLKGSLTLLKSALEGAGIAIGKVLAPAIRSVADFISKLVTAFDDLDPHAQEIIVKIGALVAAIGPLLAITGRLMQHTEKIIRVMIRLPGIFKLLATALTGPVGIIIAIITGVAMVAFVVYKNWDSIKNTLIGIWKAISDAVSSIWTPIKEFFTNIWNGVTETFTTVWQGIADVLHYIWLWIVEIFTAVFTPIAQLFQGIWDNCAEIARVTWENIKTILLAVWNAIKGPAQAIWSGIVGVITGIWDKVKGPAQSIWNGITTVIKNIWNAVKGPAQTIWNGITTTVKNIWEGVKGPAQSIWNGITSTIKNIWNSVKGPAQSIWSSVSSTLSSLWNQSKGLAANVWNATKSTIIASWNGIKSVAGGIWGGIHGVISSKMSGMKSVVQSGLSAISGFFRRCHLQLPHIKLPHFSISGSFSLNPPRVPHLDISWYKTGGVATGPAIAGIGEAGSEAIVPLRGRYMNPFADAVANRMNTANNNNLIQITINQDVKETADFRKGIGIIDNELKRRGFRLDYGRGGI